LLKYDSVEDVVYMYILYNNHLIKINKRKKSSFLLLHSLIILGRKVNDVLQVVLKDALYEAATIMLQ